MFTEFLFYLFAEILSNSGSARLGMLLMPDAPVKQQKRAGCAGLTAIFVLGLVIGNVLIVLFELPN